MHTRKRFADLATLMVTALVLSFVLGNISYEDCNACGSECIDACGTAMFRACCYNYNRKRRSIGKSNTFPDGSMEIEIQSRNSAPPCSSDDSHQVEREPYRVMSYALWKSILSLDGTKKPF